MTPSQIGAKLAVLAILCVLAVFLFPSIQRPYSAIHGPVTALQASRAAARLRIIIVQAAVTVLATQLILSRVVRSSPAREKLEVPLAAVPELNVVLRC